MPPKKPAPKRPVRRAKPTVDALARPAAYEEAPELDLEMDAPVVAAPRSTAPMKPAPRMADIPPHASLSLYRRIAFGFVFIVAAVLAVVLYVSTVEATIRVVPVEETVRADFIVDVVPTPSRETEVRGKVLAGSLGKTESFTPSGEGRKEVEGIARGTVTIHNTTGSPQALVKTTRLLTPEGALFRIDEAVNVPARGSVEASAYADQPGRTGDIAPMTFTIPGLPASLQKSIYAESAAPFSGGLSVVAVVSEADLARAVEELKAELAEDAKAMLRQEAGSAFSGESFSVEVTQQEASVEAGTEAASFDVILTVRVRAVFYDRDALQVIAVRKLFDLLEPGKEFKTVNTAGLQAVVERADDATGMANIRVYLDGVMIPSTASASLAPGRFMGMKEDEVRDTLVREGIAKSVEVEFFPPFIGRVPRLKDHIFVEVVK